MRMSLPQERTHSSRGLYTYSGAVAGGGGQGFRVGSGWGSGFYRHPLQTFSYKGKSYCFDRETNCFAWPLPENV